MKPQKGDLAICGAGSLGLITENEKQTVTYADKYTAEAYVGIHLTDKIAPVGSPWSSRNPIVVGSITRHTADNAAVSISQADCSAAGVELIVRW